MKSLVQFRAHRDFQDRHISRPNTFCPRSGDSACAPGTLSPASPREALSKSYSFENSKNRSADVAFGELYREGCTALFASFTID